MNRPEIVCFHDGNMKENQPDLCPASVRVLSRRKAAADFY